jgi:hypothetical protein
MARSAHHLVTDAERIHDIEGKQGNVRGLEHIAAGVKHEVRRLDGRGNRRRFLTQSFEHFRIELQARKHCHSATTVAVPLHALPASFGKLIVRLRDAKPRHGKQETRIDAVVAGFDAFPTLHAGHRPFARCFRTVAGTYQFEDAADDVFGPCFRDAGRLNTRTNLDALAASRAGVEHFFDMFEQSRLEWDLAHRLHTGPADRSATCGT